MRIGQLLEPSFRHLLRRRFGTSSKVPRLAHGLSWGAAYLALRTERCHGCSHVDVLPGAYLGSFSLDALLGDSDPENSVTVFPICAQCTRRAVKRLMLPAYSAEEQVFVDPTEFDPIALGAEPELVEAWRSIARPLAGVHGVLYSNRVCARGRAEPALALISMADASESVLRVRRERPTGRCHDPPASAPEEAGVE